MRVGRTTAYAEMASGKLRYLVIGGRRKILHEDAIAWLHDQAKGSPDKCKGQRESMPAGKAIVYQPVHWSIARAIVAQS